MSTDWTLPYLPLQSGADIFAWQSNVIDYPPHRSEPPESHPIGGADARDELWIALSGTATVTLDGAAHVVSPGTSIHIPAGVTHHIDAGAKGFRFVAVALYRGRPPHTERADGP